ncbi:glycosyl hydrolase family 95 catalytic domain-containing protein [Paenibacillus sp. MDMC362]|uniref:glycosyl hydrolase family 95 catalytic domain-containing protein n=1 Tax=Paenibacillus sp. MDMC362 TaxID=2977365 RepID=UPI0035942442
MPLSLQDSLEKNTLSTGDRLKRFKGGLRGQRADRTYFQFARYLLITSSQPGVVG